MTTIALVDDEPLFTAGLAMIIDSQEDLEVIWQADSGTSNGSSGTRPM